MFSYRLNGLWDAQAAAEQRFGLDTTDWKKELSKSVEVMRKLRNKKDNFAGSSRPWIPGGGPLPGL